MAAGPLLDQRFSGGWATNAGGNGIGILRA